MKRTCVSAPLADKLKPPHPFPHLLFLSCPAIQNSGVGRLGAAVETGLAAVFDLLGSALRERSVRTLLLVLPTPSPPPPRLPPGSPPLSAEARHHFSLTPTQELAAKLDLFTSNVNCDGDGHVDASAASGSAVASTVSATSKGGDDLAQLEKIVAAHKKEQAARKELETKLESTKDQLNDAIARGSIAKQR